MTPKRHTFQPEGDPAQCTIAVVCEKPANEEIAHGRLLAGTSGDRVRSHMRRVGFDAGAPGGGAPSRNVWLTNAVQSFDAVGNPSVQEIIEEQPRLLEELAALPRLNCIIAMGNAALASLTNFHCVKQSRQKGKLALSGIMSWRGSRVRSVIGTKLVPTPHPSFYLQGERRYEPIVSFDCRRAARESRSHELSWPRRAFLVEPESVQEVFSWLSELERERNGPAFEAGPCISYDIESFRGWYGLPFVSCLGLSANPAISYCIPFVRGRSPYWSVEDELAIWQRLAQLFQRQDRTYVAQNGTAFDNWVLRRHGITIPAWSRGFDTMLAHRRLAPDLPHKLEFLTSIYTEEPYYKDESGRGEAFGSVPLRQFWVYNCKDAATTLECAVGIRADLAEIDALTTFYEEDQSRVRVSAAKIERGFRVDRAALAQVRSRLDDEIAQRESDLRHELGFVPNTKSYLDMGRLLDRYSVRYAQTAQGRPSISEEQLLLYAHREPSISKVLQSCIDITQRRTLQSNFLKMRLDQRGFYHAIFDPCKTKSGRDASQSAHEGGPQLLNIPESLRHLFLPDRDDLVLTTADLKQAEAMYVAWDAQDSFLMAAFLSGRDVHRIRGCVIFHGFRVDYHKGLENILPPDDLIDSIPEVCSACAALGEAKCNHSERFISKVSGHAFAYKMGPRKFVTKVLPPAGVFISEAEGKRIRDCVVTPSVKVWQDRVSDTLSRTRWLSNPFGRKREFYGLHDEEMDREALAWIASSTITDVIAPAERCLHDLFERDPYFKDCRVVQQWYDSITVCHPPALAGEIRELMRRAMERDIWIHGRKLVIPAEFKTGSNWAFKKPAGPLASAIPNTQISSAAD